VRKLSNLVIRNGIIVIADKQYKKDIRISEDKIVEISKKITKKDNETAIDAEGHYILPGGIDPHVHLSLPDYIPKNSQWADDFESGSKAALAGGITTLGCISVPDQKETPLGSLERESKSIKQQAIADFMIHPVIFNITKEILQDIPILPKFGCTTIKIFMVTDDFDKNTSSYQLAMQLAADNGMLTMIHCEDNSMIKETCQQMINDGRGSLKHYADSRPVESEVIATKDAVKMSETTGAPIYVVHLSSEQALRVCEEGQKRALPVYVEGRPIFLYLTQDEYQKPDGAIYVVQPPLRKKSDNNALWAGLKRGSIHTVATDHAPHTREQKLDPTLNIKKLVPGINELQVMLPMLYHRGVLKNRISLEQFVNLTSTNVAKLFGIYPQKGIIQVGSDADLVIWDFSEEREIRNEEMFSQAGFSIYNGQTTIGWPVITIRRGEVVYKDRKIVAQPGSGQVLHRGPTQSLD
jgi:dihydropyrimidinase